MNTSNPVTEKPWLGLDPWGKGLIKESWVTRPALARFLWRLEIYLGVDKIDMDFFIHKPLPDVLELWHESMFGGGGLLGRALVDGAVSEMDQYLDLLFQVFEAWRNFQSPLSMEMPGVLGKSEWRKLKHRMRTELRRKDTNEFDDVHGLLQTALELELDPIHDGGDSEYFICRCPGHRIHHLELKPATGQWYCGWCPRAGESPAELREFHEENRS